LNIIKNTIIVFSLSLLTTAIYWFSVFLLLGLFIDIAPYRVGNTYYISEIILAFSIYSYGSYFAIKHTTSHPFFAALPIGITGLVLYYIELGGLDCVGVCGMPFWYDLSSFFKHIAASIFVTLLCVARKRSDNESTKSLPSFKGESYFAKLPSMKSVVVVISVLAAGLLIYGRSLLVDVSSNAITLSVYSEILKEQRTVTVFIPSGYASENISYDVLYTLDGENLQHNTLAAASAKILASLGVTPKIIVVAIHGQGMRERDFRVNGAVAVDGRKTSGQAHQFQEFLDKELIPHITQEFRTNERKLIAGHSYGALFTAYSFTEHRGSFDGYFCFSPSFQDSNTSVMSFKKGLNNNLAEQKVIYLNLGLEGGDMRELFKQVETAIDNSPSEHLHADVSYFSLPHALIMIPGYFDALYKFYRKQ